MSEELLKQLRDDNDNRHGGTVLLTGLAADRIEELEAEVKSMAMDCLVAHGQASDAYQAQLLAEAKLNDQTHLIEQFFALMDITEQTDEGRYFKPNRITSSRVMDAEKLEKVLKELKNVLEDRG